MFMAFTSICLLSCTKGHHADKPSIQVPDGFTVEVAAGPDLVDYPMFVTVDETGRLFVFESIGNVYEKTEDAIENPQFRINLLEDLDADGKYDKSTIFADKVGFPQGGVFYRGSLYASSAPDLLKFTDTDGDGIADQREILLSGWTLNINANSLIGPFLGPDGWLYMTSAIEGFNVTSKEGVQLKGETSRIWRVKPDGSDLQWVAAGGMNNPIGLTFTAASEPLGTMTYFTNPSAGQRDALMYWTEGGIYPKPNANIARDKLPRTGDLMTPVSKYSRVAPSGLCRYRSTVMGEDFFGNLFSSQFNTHRVLRHKLIREGASFRTEDEVFFSTDQEDFHPTDVQEDGDGSLLIVETGGWFIKGCPLSQVSKPELQGSIYRVRKKSASAVEDPFGKLIHWNSITADQTAAYLQDPRPIVADRSESIIASKSGALNSLANILKTSASASARTRAVFALYALGTPESIAIARLGLEDSVADVRIAAARVAGLAKDKHAINRLIQILKSDVHACKRQAATALGQIGVPAVVPNLLLAAEGLQDRYIEHAITYSLILLNQPSLTQKGLDHPSSQVKRVALIALDQMNLSNLTAEKISPYLASGDSLIQSTAVWVLGHHPEWAGAMVNYIESRMRKPVLSSNDESQLGEILVSFCGNPVMQKYIVGLLASSSPARKLFILETITACTVAEFPAVWTTAVGKELSPATDLNIKMKALNLVRLHNLISLTAPIRQIAMDLTNPASLRISAIGTMLKDSTLLSDEYFNFLAGQFHNDISPPVRLQAAAVLSQGRLSEKQMLHLALDVLPKADAIILPRLLPVFRHGKDLAVGQALSTALQMAPTLDNFTEEFLRQTFEGYPKELNASIAALIDKLNLVRTERLNRIHEIEQHITLGDIERGRRLFFGKAICSTCHAIGKEGGLFGPDMTSIQRDRSSHDLIEAIVYPGLSFVREYETYEIKTKDNTYRGIMHEQNSDFILLNTSPGGSVRIPIDEIVSTKILELSMMPEGLDRILTKQELADLMAFLLGQDQDPETDSKLLR